MTVEQSKRSGRGRAALYLQQFQTYYAGLRAKGEFLPLGRDGRVNASQVAKDAGLGDRGRLYTNPALKTAFADAVAATDAALKTVRQHDVALEPAHPDAAANRQLQAAQRRVTALEQQNAALAAETFELRRQVKALRQELERIGVMFETGRRVAMPPKRT